MIHLRTLCLVALVLWAQTAFTCSPGTPAPRELREFSEAGIGGECYFTRVPQPDRVRDWESESWQDHAWTTEFFRSASDTEPRFVTEGWYRRDILCTHDEQGEPVIVRVLLESVYDLDDPNWLQIFVDQSRVASFSPMDIILSEENWHDDGCGPLYLKRELGYARHATTGRVMFQVMTLDDRIVGIDVLDGSLLPIEQVPEVLLSEAIRSSDVEAVQALIAAGADLNRGNSVDGTPLHLAARLGQLTTVRMLIEAGAKLDFRRLETIELCDKEGNCEQHSYFEWEIEDPDNPHNLGC